MADEKAPTLTHGQSIRRLEELTAEIERLAELDELTPDQEEDFTEFREEFAKVDAHRKKLERDQHVAQVRAVQAGLPGSKLRAVPGAPTSSRADYDRDVFADPTSVESFRGGRNPWDLSEMRTFSRSKAEIGQEFRARALAAVERMQGASDNVREAATDIIERWDDSDSTISRMALATSSPEYLRGWSKMAKNQPHLLSVEEKQAMERAMSLVDASGGYLVPFQLDPTVIITSNGSRNQIRQVARQVVATGDIWNGVSAGQVTWSWAAEAAAATDNAPTFAQPTIPIRKAQGFVPISIEALQDEANVTTEVARLLAFGKDELEAKAFITGTGAGAQPTGIVTALTGTSSVVTPATDNTFIAADLYKLDGSLPARYRANASWLGNRNLYNLIRQFGTTDGANLWERLGADVPPLLLGRSALEAEEMDGDPTTAAVVNAVLVYGDFSNYVIADRVGMTVEFIPHLFSGGNLPTGQRGWFAYYRVGADSVNDGAFRMLGT